MGPRAHEFRSPWLEQIDDRPAQPLDADLEVDVAVVGAGIAGASTAFHLVRDTHASVLLLERDRLGHGATGRNAGQLVTYFERPLSDLIEEYGPAPVIAAQRDVDESWDVLDGIVSTVGGRARVDHCVGHMAMFNLDHVLVHLHNLQIRRDGGLVVDHCVVSEDAPFLDEIGDEYAGLYTLVPQAQIHELLGNDDPRYRAVLSSHKGCANGALLCQDIVAHLESAHADRFRFADRALVRRILLHDGCAEIEVGNHRVRAERVVLCTNGFVDHVVENRAGPPVSFESHRSVRGTVGYMVGAIEPVGRATSARSFIRNEHIGDDLIP